MRVVFVQQCLQFHIFVLILKAETIIHMYLGMEHGYHKLLQVMDMIQQQLLQMETKN
jgi:hypothetical protein